MLQRRDDRHPRIPGVRRHGAGWRAVVKVRGERVYLPFPLDTPDREIREEIADAKATLRTRLPKSRAGTLAADVARYLRRPDVQKMPTFHQRQQHLEEWCAILGSRRRRTITAEPIAAQRDAWLLTMEPGSVNKRLRALSNVWTLLDGRRAPNPVLEVAECAEPDPEARGLPYEVIEAILAAIPETAIGVRKDGTRTTGKNVPRPSKTKARLRVIAYTGLAHAQLKKLTREDVTLFPPDAQGHETGGTIRVVAREKGRKIRRAHERPIPKLLPLLPQAAAAFRAFDQLNCWGPFSNSSMWKAFQRACKTLGLTGLRPYDFRHSMLSAVYAETRDLRVTGELGSHRTERTVRRYTLAAVPPHIQAAIDKVRTRLESTPGAQGDGGERK